MEFFIHMKNNILLNVSVFSSRRIHKRIQELFIGHSAIVVESVMMFIMFREIMSEFYCAYLKDT
jgi:hypothetical protein